MIYNIVFILDHSYNVFWHGSVDNFGSSLCTEIATEILDQIEKKQKEEPKVFLLYFEKRETLKQKTTASVIILKNHEKDLGLAETLQNDVINKLLDIAVLRAKK